jgi:L-ribulose-5-phosphate 3-epimerase
MFKMPVGLYEKALPAELSWEERLAAAGRAGYDFVEISIDETDERLGRLDWSASERAALRRAIDTTGVQVSTMCLSGHRKYPMGSHDPKRFAGRDRRYCARLSSSREILVCGSCR